MGYDTKMAGLKIPRARKLGDVNRTDLELMLYELPESKTVNGWYVLIGGYYIDEAEFCKEHALAITTFALRFEDAKDAYIDSSSMGADSHRECGFAMCGKPLDFGGLTDCGVDSAIGLTESDPLNVGIYASELQQAANSMTHDDPRWPLWEHHARKFLSKYYGNATSSRGARP